MLTKRSHKSIYRPYNSLIGQSFLAQILGRDFILNLVIQGSTDLQTGKRSGPKSLKPHLHSRARKFSNVENYILLMHFLIVWQSPTVQATLLKVLFLIIRI